jgi:flagellar motility protein MotE (MotC chaperone)
LDYDDIDALRRTDPAWRLLRAEHAPLLLSFLGRVFVDENIRGIAVSELGDRLDDELFALNERLGEGTFPRKAKDYLDEWANTESGWLRKYYADSDEAQFDALPAVEQAVTFVRGLERREFVGTESRLNTAFELLRQIAYGAEDDPAKRLEELHRQRAAIDREIAKVERGELDYLDTAAVRDRFQQFSATARELLSDFRQVEANFRELDRQLRAQIAAWTGTKGELLDDVLTNRGDISRSEQGRTFSAFYDFLLSSRRQAEFQALLETVIAMDELAADVDARTRRIHYDWLAAAERTQETVRLLSDQLRRFLDDSVWLENRRIVEILNGIQAHALELREQESQLPGTELDAFVPQLVLPLERRLYEPKRRTPIHSDTVTGEGGDADPSALFEQTHVDAEALTRHVHDSLAGKLQVGLAEIVERHPLAEGLAELLTYFSLPKDRVVVVFDDEATDVVSWTGVDDIERIATVPKVSFVRRRARPDAR